MMDQDALDGGHTAALFVPEGEEAVGWRGWLVPALLLLVLLAPLLRPGLPATEVGALPLAPDVAEGVFSRRFGLNPGADPGAGFKALLAWGVVAAGVFPLVVSAALWGGRSAWWLAALWLTLPVTMSLPYQWATTITPQWVFLYGLAGLGLLCLARFPKDARVARVLCGIALLCLFYFWLVVLNPVRFSPPLDPYQLLAPPTVPSTSPREWLRGASVALGWVPLVLAGLAATLAWPRRSQRTARQVLGLVALAGMSAGLALLGGPVRLWLAGASLALVLAAGGLPMLDARFRAFPVQLALVALSAFSLYPALQPPVWETLPAETRSDVFGSSLWLVEAHAWREGERTVVETLWQATHPPEKDFTAFVHLLDAGGATVAQADTLLLDPDEVPSSGWPVGFLVRQRYEAASTQPPTQVRLGLYDRETLERLTLYPIIPMEDEVDSILLPLSEARP